MKVVTSLRRGIAALAVLGALSVAVHAGLERKYPHFRPGPNDAFYLPRAELLRATTLGFRQLTADLLWIRVVQSVGDLDTREAVDGFKYLDDYVDLVTDVDPRYAPTYFIASHWLTSWGQTDKAIDILKKGYGRFERAEYPDLYKFPYYIGLDYYLWKRDKLAAIEYFRQAVGLHPALSDTLETVEDEIGADGEAGKGLANFGAVLKRFVGSIEDAREREAVLPLMVHGAFYELVQQLNPAIARYREIHGALPENLEALVEAGIIPYVPYDPYEAHYGRIPGKKGGLYIDERGLVRSRLIERYWWEPRPKKTAAAANPEAEDAQ